MSGETVVKQPEWQIEVVFPVTLGHAFSYLAHQAIATGVRVNVSFGKKEKIGVVVATQMLIKEHKNYSLKPVLEILDESPLLSPALIQLIQWMVDYYHHWVGEVWQTSLPIDFWRGAVMHSEITSAVTPVAIQASSHQLNQEQQAVCQQIQQHLSNQQGFAVWLLHGVTGSGKTEVYLEAISQVLKQGKQVLMLVPEIGLTKQNIERLKARFGEINVFHSNLTAKQRLSTWKQAHAGQAKVILGTRSAIFMPCQQLGLLIIDEEHDDSYKQISGLRYHARDVAVMRARLENVPILLGSATPSYESLKNVQQQRYRLLRLSKRAGAAVNPKIRFVDMTKRRSVLSDVLLAEIAKRLAMKQQSLLFLNRRGYASVLWCDACGWHPVCPYCERSPTFHQQKKLLHCHVCDWRQRRMRECESCGSTGLRTLGEGTEQIEQLLEQHFPTARIARLDRDTTSKTGALNRLLSQSHQGEIDIILGTQMITKGHDLPKVTLVGIINVDQSLLSPNYRSEEKLLQLITQVAGRSGRGEQQGEVILQTHYPKHPILQDVFHLGYAYVATQQLQQRQQHQLPPWTYQALLRVEATSQQVAQDYIRRAHQELHKNLGQCQLYPIVPASIERVRRHYRWQCLLSADRRQALNHTLGLSMPVVQSWQRPKQLRVSLDLSPAEF